MNIETWNRRNFLGAAGAVSLLGANSVSATPEPPPETTRLRVSGSTALCLAPQFVAEELLRAEGFDHVEYVPLAPGVPSAAQLGAGEADISLSHTTNFLLHADAGQPVVALAGAHVGCYELFARRRLGALRDLRGKVVSVPKLGGSNHRFLQIVFSYIGIDPNRDVQWHEDRWADVPRLLDEEKIDAYLGFPPEPQELRARKIGHVVFSTSTDQPWNQYFCCIVCANREFVRKNPVASKRALRAIMKGVDLCAAEPARAAHSAAAHNAAVQYEYVLQMVKELSYAHWRDFSAEDTVRFYALRLHELGMLKSTPQKLLAQGTDWRLIEQLKKELKT